ncbi:MAG: hypothetical protein KYX69_19740 [Sphingomonas sp.]|uniref:hypothetical protein n=1 Tax=Sphingomonas sp. TaxID=28214 RepID=UPI00262F41F8|nr:hypothetical protein [Sphingomonas sp.]MDK2769937.1 hypothetical protein [Sphingomonas sp.]
MTKAEQSKTPWRRAFDRFGMSQSEFARTIGKHRSKVSRALKDDKGFINGDDQALLIDAAVKLNIKLTASDLLPTQR